MDKDTKYKESIHVTFSDETEPDETNELFSAFEDQIIEHIWVDELIPESGIGKSDEEIAEMWSDGNIEEGTPALETKELLIEFDNKGCNWIPAKDTVRVQFFDWFASAIQEIASPRALGMTPYMYLRVYVTLDSVWRNEERRLFARYKLEEGDIEC